MLTQLCSTLCDPIDCSPSGASTHGIFWVRMLEWVAISFSRGSSLPRDWTHIYYVTCIGKCILYLCATWEAHELLRPIGWSRNDVVRLLRLSLKRPCSLCFHHFAIFMNLPATQFQFLGWEDPLEKEMTTHASVLAGESHGQRSLVGRSPWWCKSQTWLSNWTTTSTIMWGSPTRLMNYRDLREKRPSW